MGRRGYQAVLCQSAFSKQNGGAKRREGAGIVFFLFRLFSLFLCWFFFFSLKRKNPQHCCLYICFLNCAHCDTNQFAMLI